MSTETTKARIKIDNGTDFGRVYTDKTVDTKISAVDAEISGLRTDIDGKAPKQTTGGIIIASVEADNTDLLKITSEYTYDTNGVLQPKAPIYYSYKSTAVDTKINAVKSTADTAKFTADTAKSTADNAKAAVASVSKVADTALADASTAKNVADAAKAAANFCVSSIMITRAAAVANDYSFEFHTQAAQKPIATITFRSPLTVTEKTVDGNQFLTVTSPYTITFED